MSARSRIGLWLELARPFTLLAPALGVVSGAITAAGADPRDVWTADLVRYTTIGAIMAMVLNAGNNALNQIYTSRSTG
jgi:1,4-dihydroxy-2-naphthoate octaprenyltransferase